MRSPRTPPGEPAADNFLSRYKAAGANAVDASGVLDTAQFINVAKDDALAWPAQARRAYPSTVNARMDSTIVPFIEKSLAVNNTLLAVFNDKLGLPKGALLAKHPREEYSGSESRCTFSPPIVERQVIGAHTGLSHRYRSMPSLTAVEQILDHWYILSY